MTEEVEFSKHEYGPGVLNELATKLYKNPIAAFREAVSNALDAMVPYEKQGIEPRVEIYTSVLPSNDIIIEDWGTGIENYKIFRTISPGQKTVREEVSSYEKMNPKIIGQKGMGKLSFLNLSSTHTVEFYSNNEHLGMHVTMTMDGFEARYMNSDRALSHHGLKVVIKQAKKSLLQESRLMDYLSRTFAIRISRGAKIFLNEKQIPRPEDFDSHQFELFQLDNGSKVFGNLKHAEKPKTNNIDLFVKKVLVTSKGFDYKVEGWLNCDVLDLETSRDEIYEGSELYVEFMRKLMQHLDENYEKKSETRKEIKSERQLAKMFVSIVKSISDLYPEMTNPIMSGSLSNEQGAGGRSSNLQGDPSGPCMEQQGILDKTKTAEPTVGKPVGKGKSHKQGEGESSSRILSGQDKVLTPSKIFFSGNGLIPEPKVVVVEMEEKPVVFFNAPNRLVINSFRPSSQILLNANPKDSALKSRVLPLLVRAGIDAFPGSSEMPKEEWFKKYDAILDSVWSK